MFFISALRHSNSRTIVFSLLSICQGLLLLSHLIIHLEILIDLPGCRGWLCCLSWLGIFAWVHRSWVACGILSVLEAGMEKRVRCRGWYWWIRWESLRSFSRGFVEVRLLVCRARCWFSHLSRQDRCPDVVWRWLCLRCCCCFLLHVLIYSRSLWNLESWRLRPVVSHLAIF